MEERRLGNRSDGSTHEEVTWGKCGEVVRVVREGTQGPGIEYSFNLAEQRRKLLKRQVVVGDDTAQVVLDRFDSR